MDIEILSLLLSLKELLLRNIVTETLCFLSMFPCLFTSGNVVSETLCFLSMFYRNIMFSINVSLFVPYQESSENIDRNNVSAITFPDLPKLRMKNIYILESVWGSG